MQNVSLTHGIFNRTFRITVYTKYYKSYFYYSDEGQVFVRNIPLPYDLRTFYINEAPDLYSTLLSFQVARVLQLVFLDSLLFISGGSKLDCMCLSYMLQGKGKEDELTMFSPTSQ